MIGIPSELYSMEGLTQKEINYWSGCKKRLRPLLEKYLNVGQTYYPTNITHFSMHYVNDGSFDEYFKKIRSIWQDRDIYLIHGKGIFDGFDYDIFDNAKSVIHQTAPATNAFEKYDEILDEVLKVDKGKLIIIVLGPTATILAYDLSLAGYQALDMGHLAKAYNWYKNGWEKKGWVNFFE